MLLKKLDIQHAFLLALAALFFLALSVAEPADPAPLASDYCDGWLFDESGLPRSGGPAHGWESR